MSSNSRVGFLDAQRFSLNTSDGGAWDQVSKPGQYVKDGEEITFDEKFFAAWVRNFSRQNNAIPGDVEHQLCLVPQNGQPAPLAAKYNALVSVMGGKVSAFHSQTGDAAPDVSGWPDGVHARRSEVTNYGRDLVENKGYGFISPTFVTDGENAQGEAVGPVLLTASWVVLPFLDGMQPVTFTKMGGAFNRAPVAMDANPGWGAPYGPGPHWQLPDGRKVTMYRKGQHVRFYDEAGQQVGPEQSNVVPGHAYAESNGWRMLFHNAPGAVTTMGFDNDGFPERKANQPYWREFWDDVQKIARERGVTVSESVARQAYPSAGHDSAREVVARHGVKLSASPNPTGPASRRLNNGVTAMANEKPVCPNCQQWQYPTKAGFYDCGSECAKRGFAPKNEVKMSTSVAARRFNQGAPMDPAMKFGFEEGDDDSAKLAKCLAFYAANPDEPNTMGELEIKHDDEEKEEIEAMAADLGVEPGPKVMSRIRAALSAKRAPIAEVAALKSQVHTLSQKIAAREADEAAAVLHAFADKAIADGAWDPANRANLIAFARADMKAASASLLPSGTYTLLARTAGNLADPRRPAINAADLAGKRGVMFSQAVKDHMKANGVKDYEIAARAVAKAQPDLVNDYLNG